VGTDDFVSDDLELLVDEAFKKPGLRWRLNTLNRMLGSLRKGDFGFVFARPETGKTTFLASEVTFMAEQLADDAGPILWLTNEESGKKVMIRVYQASLGVPLTTLFRDLKRAKDAYHVKTKGKILMVDNAGLSKRRVEALCEKYKPSLIVVDQLDKIKGFDNDREDLRLGAIYQWARELAKKYGPLIGICQADGTGEGQRWLTMAHVANAKTAKQAEADWILGIGKIPEAGYDTIRYLHASKNKLMGDSDSDPTLRHGRCEVLIEADVARYKDLQ
jgi:replicative DNA helicase